MAEFYILLFVPMAIQALSGYRTDKSANKKNKTALMFFFLMLTILVALRHESVGADTRNYINHFYRFSALNFTEIATDTAEFGYAYFNKIVSLISKNHQVFLTIAAIVTGTTIYQIYKHLNVDTTLTMLLFCTMSTFVMMFSGIRQMLAIAIGFIAYKFVREKRLILFVLSIALAMTLHTSAFMIAFMYPAYHIRINKKSLFWVVPLLGITLLLNENIFSFLATYLEQYTKYEADITSTGAYAMLLLFAAFTVFAFVLPDESAMDKETLGLRNFLVLSLALQMFAPLHTLAMRMNYYYIIFIPLLIPRIIMYRKKEMRQLASLARIVMVIFFTVYFFYNAYTADNNLRVFPYHFFWESV